MALKVNNLLDDAAKSIEAAAALAKAKGLYVGQNQDSYYRPNDKQDMFLERVDDSSLFEALSKAGWSASSMRC